MMKSIALAAILLLSPQAMPANSSARVTISVLPSFNTEEANQSKDLQSGDSFLSKNGYAPTLLINKDGQIIDLIY